MPTTEVWPQRMQKLGGWLDQGALRSYADKSAMTAQFKAHIARVETIVPGDTSLLILSLGDGWEPLCKSVNVPVQHAVHYPHANRAADFAKHMLMVRDIINSHFGEGDGEKAQAYRNLTDLGSASQLVLQIYRRTRSLNLSVAKHK